MKKFITKEYGHFDEVERQIIFFCYVCATQNKALT